MLSKNFKQLQNTRKLRHNRGNVPLGTTPPINALKNKPWYEKLANRIRNTRSKSNISSYTSQGLTLNTNNKQSKTNFTASNPMYQAPILEIVFVRHGESCANVLKETVVGFFTHKRYLDPELSTRGEEFSQKRGAKLREELAKSTQFRNNQYTIGSSPLLRAQETAYYMLSRDKRLPIKVMPFLGETGFGGKSPDNRPMPKDIQMAYLQKKLPEFQKDRDYREISDTYNPDYEEFLKWLLTDGIEQGWVRQGRDGVYRAVIFGHSNYLADLFPVDQCVNNPADPNRKEKEGKDPKKLHNNKLGNNDFLVTIFNLTEQSLEGKEFLDKTAVYPKWRYYDTRDIPKEPECLKCGEKNSRCERMTVEISEPCSKIACPGKGGKRKTRRLRRRSFAGRLH